MRLLQVNITSYSSQLYIKYKVFVKIVHFKTTKIKIGSYYIMLRGKCKANSYFPSIINYKTNKIKQIVMRGNVDSKSKRRLVKEFFEPNGITRYRFTKGRYAKWDCEYFINGVKYIAEIKQRRCNSDDYPTSLLEKSKFDAIVREAKICTIDFQCNNVGEGFDYAFPVYIAMFDDCMYFFNLHTARYELEVKRCPRTTSFKNRNYVDKSVVLLDFSSGVPVNYGERITQ